MIPYLVFHCYVTNELFRHLADQLKPWGVPCFVYGRREHMRHLEERGVQGFYMGPGSGPSMERVFLREPGSGAVKQYRHVRVPPALVQKHAIRMYMSEVMKRPDRNPLYVSCDYEEPGTSFAVHERDVNEQPAYLDEPLMEELTSLDLLDSVRAAPPDPTGVAVAVRGDNLPWHCGEHPALVRSHNSDGDHLRKVHMPGEVSPPPSPPPVEYPMPELISRQRDRHTSEVVRAIFTYLCERAHGTVFGGEPSWGYSLPRAKRCSRDVHLSTSWVIDGHPDSKQHRDTLSVMLTAADDVKADAIPVLPSKRPPPPRSKLARVSRLLQHRDPATPPHPDATGVASQLRGIGCAQSCAMAGEVRGAKRQSGVLDEGDASSAGGVGQSQPAEKREEFGHYLGPPAEVRVPVAPLIRKRLVPAVNAVEGLCYGNDREGDETMPPGQEENAEGKSTISVDVHATGVLAMTDSVPPNAETEASQTVTGSVVNQDRCP